jgi:exopolysaccharide biosynthesis polyprenyl glycosylphosphotransferase
VNTADAARTRHAATTPLTPAAPLSPLDVRLRAELAMRRLWAVRARTAAAAALRLAIDVGVVVTVGLLVSIATALAGEGGPHVAGTPLDTAALVVVLPLAAAGQYDSRRRHLAAATPLLACALTAVLVPIVADGVGAPDRVAPLYGFLGGAAAALVGVARVRRGQARRARPPHVTLRGAVLLGRRDHVAAAGLALESGAEHRQLDWVPSARSRTAPAVPVLAQLKRRLAEGDVSEVVVVSVVRAARLHAIATACWRAGARCLVAFDARDVRYDTALPTSLGTLDAAELLPGRLRLPSLAIKRAVDLVLTAVLVVLSVPVAALIVAAIRVESRGPAFFRQRRVGLGGREFTIWKFRSMHAEASPRREELAHRNHYGNAPLFKLPDDPRITRVGRILRRTSLDELPQLLNVLRGEMSLVGPRPPLPEEVARYAPHHRVRLSVVPGITGPWQVGGRNLITDFERIVGMEREYIEHWTLSRDVNILVRTVGVVVRGTGAY